MLAKVAKRMLKEVIKVCKRGSRQAMYADNELKQMLESALVHPDKVAEEERLERERKATAEAEGDRARHGKGVRGNRGAKVWKGIRATVKVFGGINRVHSDEGIFEDHQDESIRSPASRTTSSPMAVRRTASVPFE